MAGGTIVLTFDAGYNLGSVATGDVDLADDGSDIAIASAVVAGQDLTITNGASVVAPASVITIKIGTNAVGGVNQITNGAAGDNKIISVAGDFGDTGYLATSFIGNDVVTVDATVEPTLSFALSSNAVHFGSLTTANGRWATTVAGAAIETVGHNLTVATNAANGYNLTYNGALLTSGANNIDAATIAGDVDGTPASEQFAVNFSVSGGAGASVVSAYDQASNNHSFVAGATTGFASGNVPTNTTTYSAYYLANISPVTNPGNYTTAITYTATGNF